MAMSVLPFLVRGEHALLALPLNKVNCVLPYMIMKKPSDAGGASLKGFGLCSLPATGEGRGALKEKSSLVGRLSALLDWELFATALLLLGWATPQPACSS
jgi:hypothetical protein